MARPAKLLRVIMFGKLYGNQDWSTGYWIQGGADATDPTPTELQNSLDTIWNLGAAPYTGFRPINFTSSIVTGLRGYWYSNAGGPATSVADFAPSGGSPGTGTVRQPPLASIVLSLQTGRSGRSYRGRMYMPYTGGPAFANNGEFPNATIDTLATATQSHFNACNALDWSGSWLKSGTIVVASDTKGVSTPVTSVQIDSIVDTQHRRTNDFSPTYTKEVAITV